MRVAKKSRNMAVFQKVGDWQLAQAERLIAMLKQGKIATMVSVCRRQE